MISDHLLFAVLAGLLPLAISAFFISKHFAQNAAIKRGEAPLARPVDYGVFSVVWMFIPCLFVAVAFTALEAIFPDSFDIPAPFKLTAYLVVAALAGVVCLKCFVRPDFKARHSVEKVIEYTLLIASLISIATTVGIVISIILESLLFFAKVDAMQFLFGTEWDPSAAFEESKSGHTGKSAAKFGSIPLFWGSFYITMIALVVSIPIGLLSAIYLSEFSSKRIRVFAKPTLEILAGIPTVVYGFFAAVTVAPLIKQLVDSFNEASGWGIPVDASNALAPGLVMGVMLIPFISSLSDDIINSIPNALREGSLALGATESETVGKVIVPAAMPGIISAVILAFSRAIGETMIVVMAAGGNANISGNPLERMTTVTVKIVEALTGDTAFDSPKTLVAFALALVLFVITLILNLVAVVTIRKYKRI